MTDREWLPLHEPNDLRPITLNAEQYSQLVRDGYLVLDGRPHAALAQPESGTEEPRP